MVDTVELSREEIVAKLYELQSESVDHGYEYYMQGLTLLNPEFANVDRIVQDSGGVLVNSLQDEMQAAFNTSPEAMGEFIALADNPVQLQNFIDVLETGETGQSNVIHILGGATDRLGLQYESEGVPVTGHQETMLGEAGLSDLAEQTGTSLRNTDIEDMTFQQAMNWLTLATLPAGAAVTVGRLGLAKLGFGLAAREGGKVVAREGVEAAVRTAAVSSVDDVARAVVVGSDDAARAATGFFSAPVSRAGLIKTSIATTVAGTAAGIAIPATLNKYNNDTGAGLTDSVISAAITSGYAAIDAIEGITEDDIQSIIATGVSLSAYISDDAVNRQLLATRAFLPVEVDPTETQIDLAQQHSLEFATANYAGHFFAKYQVREYGLEKMYPDQPELIDRSLAEGFLDDLREAAYTSALEGHVLGDADIDNYVAKFVGTEAGRDYLSAHPRLQNGLSQLYPDLDFSPENTAETPVNDAVAEVIADSPFGQTWNNVTAFAEDAQEKLGSLTSMFNISSGALMLGAAAIIGVVSYMALGGAAAIGLAAVGAMATKHVIDNGLPFSLGAPEPPLA